uniref:Uncharacterized protein n=1 Tax=Psilocybe cubensis TaxID=181762 RepID=A0A8H7XZC8_PSICU
MATYYYECAVQGLPRQYSAITESTAQGQTTPCIMGLAVNTDCKSDTVCPCQPPYILLLFSLIAELIADILIIRRSWTILIVETRVSFFRLTHRWRAVALGYNSSVFIMLSSAVWFGIYVKLAQQYPMLVVYALSATALVSLLAINVPVITGPPSNKGRRTRLPVAGQDVIQLNRLQPTTAAGHDVIQHNRLQPMTDAVNHETLANIAEAVDRNASKIYSDKDSGKDIQFRAPNNSVESLFDD